MALVIDALIITVVIFLIFRGSKRGLILSLCAFLALLIAFFGARYAADRFAPPLGAFLGDHIERSLVSQLSELELPAGEELAGILQALPEIVKKYLMPQETANHIAVTVSSLLEGLKEDLVRIAAREAAALIAEAAAEFIVFTVSFAVLLVGCHLLARLLDAVFHLPLLRDVNGLFGAIFGAAQAATLALLFAWFVGKTELLISPQLVQKTYLLKFLVELVQ